MVMISCGGEAPKNNQSYEEYWKASEQETKATQRKAEDDYIAREDSKARPFEIIYDIILGTVFTVGMMTLLGKCSGKFEQNKKDSTNSVAKAVSFVPTSAKTGINLRF